MNDDEFWHLVGDLPFLQQADELRSQISGRRVKIRLEPENSMADLHYRQEVDVTHPVYGYGTSREVQERYDEDMQRVEDAQAQGYNMAQALQAVFHVRTDIQASHIIRLASKFAMWEGYRGDFEAGNEYVSGFLSGFWDARPKEIEGKKAE